MTPIRMMTTAIILASIPFFAQSEELKISTQYPDGNAVLNELRRAGSAIGEQTDGRVRVRYYPGGVMGDDRAVQRKIRIGQLQGAFVQSGALADTYRDSQVLNAPLLFRNYDEVDAVRAQLDEEIEQGFLDGGWQTFGPIEAGFAYGMSQQPITSLATLKDQKLWLPANDPFSEQIARAFGINPIVLNIGDVLTALQTGAINAIVAPPVGAITLQWYSRVDYLTNAPFMYTYGVVALSERAFNQLSTQDQAIVEAEFRKASQTIDRQTRQDNLQSFAALESLGIEILEPGAEERAALEAESESATSRLIERDQFSADIYGRVTRILTTEREAP